MKILFHIIFPILFLCGCALLGDEVPTVTGMQGRLQDNIYTSPSGSFRLRVPKLSKAASIRDEVPSPGVLRLSISDDLCREFIVSERPGNLGTQSIGQWVEENIVQDLKPLGFEIKTTTRQTPQGSVVALRYRVPGGAPCSQATKAGSTPQTKPDADVGWYVFYNAGMIYRLIYLIGVGPEMPDPWFIARAPVDSVLAQFAEGFEFAASK